MRLTIPSLTAHRLTLLTCFSLSCVTLPMVAVVEPIKTEESKANVNKSENPLEGKKRTGDSNIEVIEVSGRRNRYQTALFR